MQIKVYNGNQIGGCITIVESNKGTRICLDIGENLPSIDKKEVPEIDIIGLTKEPRNIEAVFVSHYHRRPYSDYMEKCLKIYQYILEKYQNKYIKFYKLDWLKLKL